MTRKTYTDEFKANAVARAAKSSGKVRELCKELKIAPSMLFNWRRQATAGDKKLKPLNLPVIDAIQYLKRAERLIRGKAKLSTSDLYMILALRALTGEE